MQTAPSQTYHVLSKICGDLPRDVSNLMTHHIAHLNRIAIIFVGRLTGEDHTLSDRRISPVITNTDNLGRQDI